MKKPFPGTLFRFPLRNADQAAASKLSRQTYVEDDISSMFCQLYEEVVLTMLFLKSITSVEMYVWETGASEPRKIYDCSVRSPDDNIAWHRQALLRLSSSVKSSNWQMDSFSLEFRSEALLGTHMEQKTDTFFIVQGMASASSKVGTFATTAAREYDLHLLPWASVAACISDGTPQIGALEVVVQERRALRHDCNKLLQLLDQTFTVSSAQGCWLFMHSILAVGVPAPHKVSDSSEGQLVLLYSLEQYFLRDASQLLLE